MGGKLGFKPVRVGETSEKPFKTRRRLCGCPPSSALSGPRARARDGFRLIITIVAVAGDDDNERGAVVTPVPRQQVKVRDELHTDERRPGIFSRPRPSRTPPLLPVLHRRGAEKCVNNLTAVIITCVYIYIYIRMCVYIYVCVCVHVCIQGRGGF